MTEIIVAILGGSALSALITQIGSYIAERRRRKDSKEDTEDTKDAALKQGMKLLLADKIQYLGLKYIEEGEITFSNRKILNEMHSVYHNGLDGNGNFDELMKEWNELPIKGRWSDYLRADNTVRPLSGATDIYVDTTHII